MIRWRLCLVLALLASPTRIGSKSQEDDDDDERVGDSDEEEYEDEDEEEEEPVLEKSAVNGRRAVPSVSSPSPTLAISPGPLGLGITKTPRRRPLECFACAYNSKTNIKSCLDPAKYRQDRVHSITCTDVSDKCYTTIVGKAEALEGVIRGCRPNCMTTPDTTCCDSNRCNSHAYVLPEIQPRVQKPKDVVSTTNKPEAKVPKNRSTTITPNIFFFVTILLLLQTVVKVSFI